MTHEILTAARALPDSFSRFRNSGNVKVPAPSPQNPKRFERSAAVERFERIERATVLSKRLNLSTDSGQAN